MLPPKCVCHDGQRHDNDKPIRGFVENLPIRGFVEISPIQARFFDTSVSVHMLSKLHLTDWHLFKTGQGRRLFAPAWLLDESGQCLVELWRSHQQAVSRKAEELLAADEEAVLAWVWIVRSMCEARPVDKQLLLKTVLGPCP